MNADQPQLLPGPRRQDSSSFASIKAAYFDIDNTLVANDSPEPPTPDFLAVAARANDHIVIGLATARSLNKVSHILGHMPTKGLVILTNGAQIYDVSQGKMVAEWPMPVAVAVAIANLLQTSGHTYWVNDSGVDLVPVPDSDNPGKDGLVGSYAPLLDIWDKTSRRSDSVVSQFVKPLAIAVQGITADTLSQLRNRVGTFSSQGVTSEVANQQLQPDGTYLYDLLILDLRANKKDALNLALDMQHLAPSQAMFVGEGQNDAGLVELVGLGIAMGNAVTDTKNVAAFIAPDREHDGAARALETLLDSLSA